MSVSMSVLMFVYVLFCPVGCCGSWLGWRQCSSARKCSYFFDAWAIIV